MHPALLNAPHKTQNAPHENGWGAFVLKYAFLSKRRRFEHNIIFCKVIATMFKLQKENSRG